MCIACRQMFDKKDLTRVVKNKEGQIFVDSSGKANGRGAYVCTNQSCLEKLKKQKILNKAFKCMVEEKIYKQLEEEIANR